MGQGHHEEVASLDPTEQNKLLDMAERQEMNREDFRKAIREYKKTINLPPDPGNLPQGKFAIVYADPPWKYRDTADHGERGAEGKIVPEPLALNEDLVPDTSTPAVARKSKASPVLDSLPVTSPFERSRIPWVSI